MAIRIPMAMAIRILMASNMCFCIGLATCVLYRSSDKFPSYPLPVASFPGQ